MIKGLVMKALPVAAAVAALVATAGVSTTTAAVRSTNHPSAGVHVVYSPATATLSNWAGYIAEGTKGEFTSAAADWTVPSVTCLKDSDLYAPWVGIDGAGDSTVEQTGVQTACNSGSPAYSAWYEMYPKGPVYFTNPIAVGDDFSASVTFASGSFTIVISDVTKGWTRTVTKKLASAKKLSAEAVIEAPGGYPAITSVNFTNVVFDGKNLATFHPVKSLSGSGKTVYHPTKITHGSDFNVVPNP
jgi:hypothetical protein